MMDVMQMDDGVRPGHYRGARTSDQGPKGLRTSGAMAPGRTAVTMCTAVCHPFERENGEWRMANGGKNCRKTAG